MSVTETISKLLVQPLLGPFPPAQTLALARRGTLQKRVETVAADPKFSGMGIALIDMTGGRMEYAGVRDNQQLYGASLVKIVAMFAAYALRERARDVAKVYPATDRKAFFQRLTAMWKQAVERKDPRRTPDFPQLTDIFNATGTLDFNDAFMGHLKEMIHWSDNHSAQAVIRALGYQYINGASANAGLYSGVGLWLGADFAGGRVFGEIRVDPAVNPKVHSPSKLTTQGASAATVARFMALLETDKLVRSVGGPTTANQEMRDLMAGQRLTSPFRLPLNKHFRLFKVNRFYGKIGVGYGVNDDCAFIERQAVVEMTPRKVEKQIKYVAVGLREPQWFNSEKLMVRLDRCIVEEHNPRARNAIRPR